MSQITKTIKKPRFILAVFLTGTLIFGTGLILNAYLLTRENTVSVANVTVNSTETPNELGLNPPIELEEIKGISTENVNKFFSNNITSAFAPKTESGRAYLKLKSDKDISIGYIDKRNIFIKLYTLPLTITNLNIYSNESITYVENTLAGAIFKGRKLQDELFSIDLSLLGNSFINNIYYYNTDFNFYIATSSENELIIYKVSTDNEIQEIYRLNSDYKSYKILNIESNKIYIKNNLDNCFSIELSQKVIKTEKCLFLEQNDYKYNLLGDNNGLGVVNLENGEIKTISNAAKSNITNFFELNNNELYFLTKLSASSVELNIIQLNNESASQLNIEISDLSIQNTFALNGSTYLITKGSSYKLLKLKEKDDLESAILKNSNLEDFYEVNFSDLQYQSIELLNSQIILFKN